MTQLFTCPVKEPFQQEICPSLGIKYKGIYYISLLFVRIVTIIVFLSINILFCCGS